MSVISLFQNWSGNINLGLDTKQLFVQSSSSHTNHFEEKKIAHRRPQKASQDKEKIQSATQGKEFRELEKDGGKSSDSFWTETLTQCKTVDNLYHLCRGQDYVCRKIINRLACLTEALWGTVSYCLQNVWAPWYKVLQNCKIL